MDFESVVRRRRSIRKFRSEPVPQSEVVELIDLARHAPSSMNGQPWHFVLIASPETKSRLADIKDRYCPSDKQAYPAGFLRQAAWVVVVCVDGERTHGRAVESAVAATTILLLAACERGLGSTFLTAYADGSALSDEIGELLDLPSGFVPITLIPLGRPDESPPAKQLPPLASIVHVEKF